MGHCRARLDNYFNFILHPYSLQKKEKFRALTSSYYRGAHGIVVVFDVTSKESFDHVEVWLNEAKLYAIKSEPTILLIGNKVDKPVSFKQKIQVCKISKKLNPIFSPAFLESPSY